MRPSPRREANLRVLTRVGFGAAASAALAVVACSATARTRNSDGRDHRPTIAGTSNGALAPGSASLRVVRIALARGAAQVRLASDDEWTILAADGRTTLALPRPRESWILDRAGSAISLRREDSRATSQRDLPIIVRPVNERATINFNGRRWRGELAITVTDGGLLVVNRLRMDDYLKGVVPLEIGTKAPADA